MDRTKVGEVEPASWRTLGHSLSDEFSLQAFKTRRVLDAEAINEN